MPDPTKPDPNLIAGGPDNKPPAAQPHPDQGLPGGPPPSPDNTLPPQPPGIWGGAPSYPDQGLPPAQGHPGNRPPWAPAYPTWGPYPPLGIWGGAPGYPDQGLPYPPHYPSPGPVPPSRPVDPGYGQGMPVPGTVYRIAGTFTVY